MWLGQTTTTTTTTHRYELTPLLLLMFESEMFTSSKTRKGGGTNLEYNDTLFRKPKGLTIIAIFTVMLNLLLLAKTCIVHCCVYMTCIVHFVQIYLVQV